MADRGSWMLIRLAFVLMLTPWPLVLWIRAQGKYTWSPRHDAEALGSVLPLLIWAIPLIFAVSLFLVLKARRTDLVLLSWLLFSMWNGLALWQFIAANSMAYA